MNKYLITYDLKNTSLVLYAPLHEEIKKISGLWWHYLESTWIVKTNLTASEISAKLIPHIKQGDRLIVVKIDYSDSQGWLPKEAWDWINS